MEAKDREASKPIDIAKKLGKLALEDGAEHPVASLGSLSQDVQLFLKASELERNGRVSQGRTRLVYTAS